MKKSKVYTQIYKIYGDVIYECIYVHIAMVSQCRERNGLDEELPFSIIHQNVTIHLGAEKFIQDGFCTVLVMITENLYGCVLF